MPTIKELRIEKKLSQSAFAKSIGISLSSVSHYEKGMVNPGKKVLEKIKEVYGVDVSAPAPVEAVAEAPAPEAKKGRGKKAAPAPEKPRAKKAAAKAEKAPAVKKPRGKKAAPEVIIQSPLGGEITPADILSRIGEADKVYIRVDENKAYWVRGEESGSIDLW